MKLSGTPTCCTFAKATAGIVMSILVVLSVNGAALAKDLQIPLLIGKWVGENKTISDDKGYRVWGKKTIYITEQKDRRFRGFFDYKDGRVDFFGVIFPDNRSFSWVSSGSRGYNMGRILSSQRIGACYIEAGIDATAGCAELELQPNNSTAKPSTPKTP